MRLACKPNLRRKASAISRAVRSLPIFAPILLAISASAATIHVPADAPTIAAGLGMATAGDVIVVACGTYFEHDLAVPSGVTLRSETGAADCVVIDAQMAGRGLMIQNANATTRVEGITIQNGRGPSGLLGADPALAAVEERIDATVDDATADRIAVGEGGGGAAYVGTSSPTFASCVFRNNTSSGNGGAVRSKSSSPSFADCVFENNKSTLNGGALSLESGAGASIVRSEFRGNRGRLGGGVWLSQIGAALIDQSIFLRNSAGWSVGQGNGGGVAVVGGALQTKSSTFVQNGAGLRAGGIHASSFAQVTLDATIIAVSSTGSAVHCETGATFSLSCSDLYGNPGGNYVGCAAGQHLANGNVSVEPLFCDPALGDLRLASSSYCLAANNPCGRQIGARGQGCNVGTRSFTVTTQPVGLLVVVDGATFTSPAAFSWALGTSHTISVPTPQDAGPGVRRFFSRWSDSDSNSHSIVASLVSPTYIAYFETESFLTMQTTTGGTVTPSSQWRRSNPAVTINALPAGPSWAFSHWVGTGSGSYSGTNVSASIHVSAPITQTAYFTQDVRTLTVQQTGQGTVTPATGAWVTGRTVAISAIPAAGWYFSGWTGSGNGSYTGLFASATVTMNADLVQTAQFTQAPPLLPLTMIANPGGTVSPSGDFPYNSGVAIYAYPDSGFRFTGWTGVGEGSYTGNSNPGLVVMRSPITQTASFTSAPPDAVGFWLTTIAGPNGTVTPPTGFYPPNAIVTVTATPNPGYVFLRWESAASGYGYVQNQLSNPQNVVMSQPATREAVFAPQNAPLTLSMVASPQQGTVTPSTGPFPALSQVTIRATPAQFYTFDQWYGSGAGSYSGSQNPATVKMHSAIMQTAIFRPTTYRVTLTAGPGGTVKNLGARNYNAGTSVELIATPNPGYAFTGWTGTGTGSYTGMANPGKITVLSIITESATFVATSFQLTMDTVGQGTTSPLTSSYPPGTVVPIEAFPDSSSGYGFLAWSGSGLGSYSGPNRAASVTMHAPITQIALFTHGVPITFETDPPGRNVVVDGQSIVTPHVFDWAPQSFHSVSADSVLPIDAGARHRFASWSNGLDRVHTYYVPDSATTVTASYVLQHLLTVIPGSQGTVAPGTGWRDAGAALSLTANANPNFAFESWTGSGDGSYSGDANPAPITMSGPITQTAAYHSIGFDFSISASATDPFVNVAAPSGGVRSLHLWSTCAEAGLSAFQGVLAGSFVPLAFVPASGSFNIGSATSLLLAVAGCPTGASIAVRLGEWIVVDTGGDMCFAPSTPTAPFAAVDCDSIAPSYVTNPRLLGFSSSGAAPCVLNVNPCSSSGPPPAADLSMLRSGDTAPASIALPLMDAFVGVSPNPFEGTTEIRFSTAAARGAQVTVYDVTGRLVRRLVDGALPAGEHRLAWDGRNAAGERAPSGVYFMRLESGPLQRTEKIVSIGGSR